MKPTSFLSVTMSLYSPSSNSDQPVSNCDWPPKEAKMIAFETLITFFTAAVLLALVPGPDNIFVLTQSALRGRSSGIVVMLGLCTDLIVHSVAVALGVAVIFQTSSVAFSILKFIGAGYLIYLAWQAFRAPAEEISGKSGTKIGHGQLYRRGIIMNITNPKVAIFFLAFLPQFADPAKGSITIQMMMFVKIAT